MKRCPWLLPLVLLIAYATRAASIVVSHLHVSHKPLNHSILRFREWPTPNTKPSSPIHPMS